jgi:hypothetical protein
LFINYSFSGFQNDGRDFILNCHQVERNWGIERLGYLDIRILIILSSEKVRSRGGWKRINKRYSGAVYPL